MEAADETRFIKCIGTEKVKAKATMERQARKIRHYREAPVEAEGAVEKKGAFHQGFRDSTQDIDGVVAR